MKLLHSKSTTEPILAVTACPCANLFGLVTQSSVVVYRSTTLTTVFTFSLKPFQSVLVDDGAHRGMRNGCSICCCWSPSGRLFTLAMPSGLLLVLDVEGGALVRYLTPGATATASGDEACCSPPTSSSVNLPRVSTTLPPGRPVLAMGWCAVPSLLSRQINDMHADMQTRCLPVRTGLSAALLDEVVQGPSASPFSAGDAAHLPSQSEIVCDGYPAHARGGSRSVSLLLVLGCDGALRCLLGGLYEVQSLVLSLPTCLPAQPDGGISGRMGGWEGVVVEDMQVRQCSVPTRASAAKRKHARKGTDPCDWVRFGESAANGVRPAVAQKHLVYLTVRDASASGTGAHSLWEVDLHTSLSALATPQCLALCYVREYTRIAREAYERVSHEWHAVLRGRLWAHLGLPAVAPLLSSAILAQLTEPDPLALFKYARGQLMRSAVADDLEVVEAALKRTICEVTCVCYPSCEAAMSYSAHLRKADTALQHLVATLRRLCESLLRRVTREAEVARDLSQWVLQQSRHWERDSRLNLAAVDKQEPVEAEEDTRETPSVGSSPPAAVAAPVDMARSPSPQQPPSIVDEVPLSATRQPALLKYLTSIPTQATSIEDDPILRLFTELDISAQGGTSVPASSRAPFAARMVYANAQETDAASALASSASQLLCCVVEEAKGGGQRSREDDDEDDDDGAVSGLNLRYETGLEDVRLGERERNVACDQCGCALVTERSQVHVLRTSGAAGNTIQPLHMSTYDLVVRCGGDVTDNDTNSTASVLKTSSTADVDTRLIAPLLKAELTSNQSSATSPATYGATWYGYLEEDRHVVVCQPDVVTTGRSATSVAPNMTTAPAPFFVAVVDSAGCLVTVAEEEHNSDNEDAAESSGAPVPRTRGALCEVTGMEGVPLRVSMSRSRSFCVVVGITKYVILSLYDDEY
ncbi:hypothetical protein JKF63_05571 [Porcisia hertigi]|uniref:Anaphase-promoting complex subunit 4 n=1 Tax=Porcisia hertigi TaxID=2761500 RepID=A0A836IDZ2_9TRYP|nr:hypothetical protein JKF63_05571 [Porcisia hertigi]